LRRDLETEDIPIASGSGSSNIGSIAVKSIASVGSSYSIPQRNTRLPDSFISAVKKLREELLKWKERLNTLYLKEQLVYQETMMSADSSAGNLMQDELKGVLFVGTQTNYGNFGDSDGIRTTDLWRNYSPNTMTAKTEVSAKPSCLLKKQSNTEPSNT